MGFPNVQGSNLQGRKFNLPRDFEGAYNIVLIAFQQHQQYDVETWMPFVRALAGQHPSLRYYELPTIWRMPFFKRLMLDMSMRMGIPDKATREVTITLYLDKPTFRRALGIHNEHDITILLVDPAGRIMWQTTGRFNDAKGASLSATLCQYEDVTCQR